MKPANLPTLVIAGVVLALAALAIIAKPWDWLRRSAEVDVVVTLAPVERHLRPLVVRVSGTLQPIQEVDVTSRLAGRLTEVNFKTGDFVTAGALVALVSSGVVAERARTAEADLSASRKLLQGKEQASEQADKQLARWRELYNQQLIARRDVEAAEIEAATARAQLDLLRAQIAQEEAMLAQVVQVQQLARIVAPVSGVVTGALSVGAPVNEARAILSIGQTERLKLVGEVAADLAELVHEGMTVAITPRQGTARARTGTLTRLDKTAPGEFLSVEISVDNRDRAWKIGVPVDASLTLARQEPVLTIPLSALLTEAGKQYVYLVADRRALRRAVEVAESADPAVIRSGLKVGDQVIVSDLGKIKDGTRVIIRGK